MVITQVSEEESREIQRISSSLPVKVEIRLNDRQTWEEITHIKDVSAFGAGFFLSRPVARGQLVFLTTALPVKLRMYDLSEAQYRIWGIVRRCIPINCDGKDKNLYSIGIGFIGRRQPPSYNGNPLTTYDIKSRDEDGFWVIKEINEPFDEDFNSNNRRQHSRFGIPLAVTIEILDDAGNAVAFEETVTENISLKGAAIFCSYSIEPGYFLRVTSKQYNVSIISVVRGMHTGADNIQRLHVEFIDRFFPLEKIT